jgi:hypothetical protein
LNQFFLLDGSGLAMSSCLFFAGGHVLGAAFNQLVRSRAQLLLLEQLFVPSEQADKPAD